MIQVTQGDRERTTSTGHWLRWLTTQVYGDNITLSRPTLTIKYLFQSQDAHMARLEMRVMVEQVMQRIPDLELAGPPERLCSNFVAGIKHMPVRFTPSPMHAQA